MPADRCRGWPTMGLNSVVGGGRGPVAHRGGAIPTDPASGGVDGSRHVGPRGGATDSVGDAGPISPATREISSHESPSAHSVSANEPDQNTRSSIVHLHPT